ncbi:10941_t:CDS:2, partial [Racocetra persica]
NNKDYDYDNDADRYILNSRNRDQNTVFNITLNISTESPQNTQDYFELTIYPELVSQTVHYSNSTHPILRGQWLVLEFSIIYKHMYLDRSRGIFSFDPDELFMYTEFKEKQVLPLVNASYSILELIPARPPFRHEKESFQHTFGTLLSEIGGIHNFFSALIIFFFGASKFNPWNCCERMPLFRPIRRQFKINLARRYNTKYGIPLSDNLNFDEIEKKSDSEKIKIL